MTPNETARVDQDNVKGMMVKRTRTLAGGLVALCLWGAAALAGPDLHISELIMNPETVYVGTHVRFEASIENVGDVRVDGQIYVRFEVDGSLLENVVFNADLGPGQSQRVQSKWVAEEGSHTISANVDRPFDRVREDDEQNNEIEKPFFVLHPSDVRDTTGGTTIAISSFSDATRSGLIEVGRGVADKLGERLEAAGVRIVPPTELQETLRIEGLNPYSLLDLTAAARRTGADLLLTGTVSRLELAESALQLGALSIGTTSAEVHLAVEWIDATDGTPIGTATSFAHQESTAELSLDLASLLSLPPPLDPCGGGLQTQRNAYYAGESVLVGLRNSGPDGWFGVEILSTSDAFVQWLGWRFIPSGECGQWVWNQRDAFGTQVPPSVYEARIAEGSGAFDSVTFQIRPGSTLRPLANEITLGSPSFEESAAGQAVNEAVDRLLGEIIPALEQYAASSGEGFDLALAPDLTPSGVAGRVAAVLPDGRVVINAGGLNGVSRGDFFEIVNESDGLVRGEVVVVEVRDQVSYTLRTDDFQPSIGDPAFLVTR